MTHRYIKILLFMLAPHVYGRNNMQALSDVPTPPTANMAVQSAKKLPASICKSLNRQKTPTAVWVDANGAQVGGALHLGSVDKTGDTGAAEYVTAEHQFRLILVPPRLTVSDSCSLSLCVEPVKVKPRCAGTSEYAVNISILPSKFGPGPFVTEAMLTLEDARSNYPMDIDLLSGRPLTGTVFIPWLELQNAGNDAARGMADGSSSAGIRNYRVANVGNRTVQLSAWEKGEGSAPGIDLVDSTCSMALLAPGTACNVTFRITPAALHSRKHAFWGASGIDGRGYFTIHANIEDGKSAPDVTLKNQ